MESACGVLPRRQVRDCLYVNDIAGPFVALLHSNVERRLKIASGKPPPRYELDVGLRHTIDWWNDTLQ